VKRHKVVTSVDPTAPIHLRHWWSRQISLDTVAFCCVFSNASDFRRFNYVGKPTHRRPRWDCTPSGI